MWFTLFLLFFLILLNSLGSVKYPLIGTLYNATKRCALWGGIKEAIVVMKRREFSLAQGTGGLL